MATYAAQSVTDAALAATYNAAANGDKVPPGVLLHVKNANAASLTVTINTPKTLRGDLQVDQRTFTVPATTGERFFRVPDDDTYRDPTDGLVTISTWSVTASVTYAVLI